MTLIEIKQISEVCLNCSERKSTYRNGKPFLEECPDCATIGTCPAVIKLISKLREIEGEK